MATRSRCSFALRNSAPQQKNEVAPSNWNGSFGAPETKTISVSSERISAAISGAARFRTANAPSAQSLTSSKSEVESDSETEFSAWISVYVGKIPVGR